jgi:hypothetical protein
MQDLDGGAELAKVNLPVSVGVHAALQDPPHLGVSVCEPLGAHEAGKAGLVHALLALGGGEVGMRVKRAAESRFVKAVRNRRRCPLLPAFALPLHAAMQSRIH